MNHKTLPIIFKIGLGIVGLAVVLLLLFLTIMYFVCVVLTDDSMKNEDIFSLVIQQEHALVSYIDNRDFSEVPPIDGIKAARLHDDTIEFSCGGSGLGSATYYCGFYYSETDDLYGMWCAPAHGSNLKPDGNGFLYEESNGDNRYYTEHISGHFYYYEAFF